MFVELSDESHDFIISELLQQYLPVILSVRSQYYLKDMLLDDWLQEGMIILFKCYQSYDEQYGSTFGSYFKKSFQHHIYSLLRKQLAVKRQADYQTVSYEQLTQEYGTEFFDSMEKSQAGDQTQRMIVKETISNYPMICAPLERKVMALFLQGYELTEIKIALDLTERATKSAFYRAVKKIRQEIS